MLRSFFTLVELTGKNRPFLWNHMSMELLVYSLTLDIFKDVVRMKTNVKTSEFFTKENSFLEHPIGLPHSAQTLSSPRDQKAAKAEGNTVFRKLIFKKINMTLGDCALPIISESP